MVPSRPAVRLVSMPWASTVRPSLGIGLLVAAARERGFACTAAYPNLTFATIFGCDAYEYVGDTYALFGLAEHLFAVDIFGTDALNSDDFLSSVEASVATEAPDVRFGPDTLYALRDVVVPAFLDQCVDELARSDAEVIGFSCVFNQMMPSLAAARRLKAIRPQLTILLGGASVHGPMGEAYARAFGDCVDHVFVGEADVVFPSFLQALADGRDVANLPGVTSRGTLKEAALPVFTLDELPPPDYSDYFRERERLERHGYRLAPVRDLPYESARGCWWGEKHHCTFCGLNGENMGFRAKSSSRVIAELTSLSQRHQETSFAAVDNILAHSGYADLLPKIAGLGLDLRLFYEIKANVTRDKVAALRSAGVRAVQPGIESFSDNVLGLMRKGVSSAQNVQLLRLLQEFGIGVVYNLLVGFPGETDADYETMLELLPRLFHLPPPVEQRVSFVQVHRFSPFHADPVAFGLTNVRAAEHYRHLIPPDVLAGEEFGYVFDREIEANAPVLRYADHLDAVLAEWGRRKEYAAAELGPGFVLVRRSAGANSETTALDRLHSLVLLLTDSPTSPDKIARSLAAADFEAARVDDVLDDLVRDKLVVRIGERYVSVVPFERPHTSHDLRLWADRWGAASTLATPS